MSPYAWRQIRADLAMLNHWQPSELDELDWADMVLDHVEAVARWNAMHARPEGEKP